VALSPLALALTALLPFAQLAPAGPAPVYGTARPAECSLSDGIRAANAWERAKEPNLRRYCDLIASGTAKLVGPGSSVLVKEVPQIADEADKLLPNRASSAVLKGRAFLRLGRPEDALAALVEARRRDERALDEPIALLAWARANARTGHLAEAAQAYRAALPRTSALSAQDRSAAAFEAGMTVMAQGAAGIDDAIAMFRQARRDAQDAMQVASVVALALALDRGGQREESKAVATERVRSDVKGLLSDPRVALALADAGAAAEKDALVAIASENVDGGAAAAKEAWRAYVDGAGGKGPWAEHARERVGGSAAAPKPAARPHVSGGGTR
jgi:tetratricopeptide (TPR) repeat protein